MSFASSDVHSCVFVSSVFLDVDFSIFNLSCVVGEVAACRGLCGGVWLAGWERVVGGGARRVFCLTMQSYDIRGLWFGRWQRMACDEG